MISLGKHNCLKIVREAPPGFYLDAEEKGEILLPRRYIPKNGKPGDWMDVFVYLDSEDRLVATTEKPIAEVGSFATLEVVSINPNIGAFLNWGLAKDLLLPYREQENRRVRVGDNVVVFITIDEKTNRIIATMRLHWHFSDQHPPYSAGRQVDIVITGRTPLGYNAIVESAYRGLLYQNISIAHFDQGTQMKAYVRAVRPDGKIDLSLDATGFQRAESMRSLRDQILDALKENGGHLDYDDDSSPEVIRATFGVSKKTFKQTTGALYKARLIEFTRPGMRLTEGK